MTMRMCGKCYKPFEDMDTGNLICFKCHLEELKAADLYRLLATQDDSNHKGEKKEGDDGKL